MKLLKFKAKNFKNLENFEVTFSNYNLISGDNGSGKSSVLQGIAYCLTDKLPEKLSEYVLWGKEFFELTLDFEHNGDMYNYYVKYSTSTKKELSINKDVFLRGGEAANHISKIVNSELLLYSSISEQGQSYSILTESPAERLKKFKTILGIDKLSRIVENVKKEISQKKSEADLLKKEIEILSSKQFTYLEDFDLPDISELSKTLQLQETYREVSEKNQKLQSVYDMELGVYKKESDKQIQIKKELEEKEGQLCSIDSKDFDETLYSNLLGQKKEFEFKKSEYDLKKKSRLNYLQNLQNLKFKQKSLEEKKNGVKLYRISNLEYDESYLKSINENIQNLSVTLKQLKNHEKLAREGKCPSCGQDFKHDLKSLLLEIDTVKAEHDTLISEYEMKKSALDDYQKKNLENSKSREIIKVYEDDLVNLSEEINSLVEVPEPEDIQLDESFLKTLTTLEKEKADYEKNKQLIDSLRKQIEGLKFEISRFTELKKPVEPSYEKELFDESIYLSVKKELNIYEEKKSRLLFVETHNKKVKEEEENHKTSIKDKEVIYYNLIGEISILEESRTILDKQFSSYLIEKGTEYVEFQMNNFFQRCYSRYTVYFRQTESKNSIDFFYTDKVGKIVSASLCSGFEKQLLSIAFRVALASITGLGFLVLDEIDSDASEENSIKLYSNLIDSNLFSQIICISHKAETKQYLLNNHQTNLIELGDFR